MNTLELKVLFEINYVHCSGLNVGNSSILRSVVVRGTLLREFQCRCTSFNDV